MVPKHCDGERENVLVSNDTYFEYALEIRIIYFFRPARYLRRLNDLNH